MVLVKAATRAAFAAVQKQQQQKISRLVTLLQGREKGPREKKEHTHVLHSSPPPMWCALIP